MQFVYRVMKPVSFQQQNCNLDFRCDRLVHLLHFCVISLPKDKWFLGAILSCYRQLVPAVEVRIQLQFDPTVLTQTFVIFYDAINCVICETVPNQFLSYVTMEALRRYLEAV